MKKKIEYWNQIGLQMQSRKRRMIRRKTIQDLANIAGTIAEGWIDEAIDFWEAQSNR